MINRILAEKFSSCLGDELEDASQVRSHPLIIKRAAMREVVEASAEFPAVNL